ncbi:MAG TPA: transglycosylase SLT domain-containing protein [Bacteroidales bacterium]|nr:transglycosylase SLT domain-containing protein [Bacteroidales bacterium]HOR59787.1 transglycosylase SLT domain-containing protein [Bacteroidales bacterium]HQB21986.1 transglycosylase SLT domain-containing protein [Bacteroidales bacterium]
MSSKPGSHIKSFRIFTIILSVILLILGLFAILHYFKFGFGVEESKRDYEEIIESKKLKVVLATNPIDYFIYQGQPMGFQLEMLESFAKSKGLDLVINIENDVQKGLEMLLNRECDILAQGIVNSLSQEAYVNYTLPIRSTRLVLVKHVLKNEDILNLKPDIEDNITLKYIYVGKNQTDTKVLKTYLTEIIPNFYLVEIDSLSNEAIIKNVSEGIFDFAVVDYNIAKISESYWHNIDYSTDVSVDKNISWSLRPESKQLLDSVNFWLEDFLQSNDYRRLNLKYINNNKILVDLESDFYSISTGKISEYDDKIRKYSKLINWDWRLVSSLIYEESRFNPDLVSWAGAYGLMQLMPVTFNTFKDPEKSGVDAQIYAGVKYIEFLDKKFFEQVPKQEDRIYFVLASYNIGPGHVEDAIRLAEKYKEDVSSWESVAFYLSNMSNSKYYNDPVVVHGYYPGIYAVSFAESIVKRYEHYKNIIPK